MFAGARSRYVRYAAVVAMALSVTAITLDTADARRASGGFGSRGTRTFQSPSATPTAPSPAAPINRTMTQPNAQTPNAAQPQMQPNAQRGGMFGGFGRSMLGGLLVGGLFGALLGSGFGGGFGFLGMLLQIALIGGAIMLAMRFFANRRQQSGHAPAGAPRTAYEGPKPDAQSFRMPSISSLSGSGSSQPKAPVSNVEVAIRPEDLDQFEKLLSEVQGAYSAEDYPTLRKLTTPEAMSYLAEELGENATKGVRNSVSDVRLLQGDISESWREGETEYATLAMRYESIDTTVDRNTGKLLSSSAGKSEATEIWTFVRTPGVEWKLSAIQATDLAA